MEDVKTALRPVKWMESVKEITVGSAKLPLIAKPTPETAETYGISEEPVLLHQVWVTQRLVAQSMEEEGTYVIGPQMDIPSEYTGTFQYSHNQKGNNEEYLSVKDIAYSLPERVFVQERLVVYPVYEQEPAPAQNKVKSLVLQPSTQLNVIEKKDVVTLLPPSNRLFGVMSKSKSMLVQCLSFKIVRNEATSEIINLPLTTRGKFCTMLHIPRQGRELDFRDILNEIDLPINLTTCRNCPQTLLDQHFLRPGLRLRITTVEEYQVIIGISTDQRIIEFNKDGVEFVVPEFLDGFEDKEQEIAYQTSLQRFIMECQIKNSPVNVKDYKKSIRTHIARTVRLTKPKPLGQMASSRVGRFSGNPDHSGGGGFSAIQLLMGSDSVNRMQRMQPRWSSMSSRPLPSRDQNDVPPLPPRNSHSMRHSLLSPVRTRSARHSATGVFDLPTRPPPPPPEGIRRGSEGNIQGSLAAPLSWGRTSGKTAEFPTRPPPAPPAEEEVPEETSISASPSLETTASEIKDEKTWKTLDENCVQASLEENTSIKRTLPNMSMYENTNFSDVSGTRGVNDFDDACANNCLGNNEAGDYVPLDRNVAEAVVSVDVQGNLSELESNETSDIPPLTDTVHDEIKNAHSEAPPQLLDRGGNDCAETADSPVPFSEDVATQNLEKVIDSLSISSEDSGQRVDSESGVSSSSKDSCEVASSTSGTKPASTVNFHLSQYSVASDCSGTSLHHVSFTCNYAQSPRDWEPPHDLSEMTVKEVADSLRYIGMTEDTVEWFVAEKVDGRLLCGMNKGHLAQHFRLTPFQQHKITMFVEGWRPKLL